MKKILGLLLVTGIISAPIFVLCKQKKLPIKNVLHKSFRKDFFRRNKE